MRRAYIEDAATFVPNGEIGRRYGAPRFEMASAFISCHTNLTLGARKVLFIASLAVKITRKGA